MTSYAILAVAAASVALPARNAAAQQASAQLPPPPVIHGALRLDVVYPAPGAAIEAGDSTFVFGAAGDGAAQVTVAGQPARVAANGAWLAWIAIPDDSALLLPVIARLGQDSVATVLHLTRAGWLRERGAWVDPRSLAPSGAVWMPAGEPLPLSVRAAPGAVVRLLLPGGVTIRLVADSLAEPLPPAVQDFGTDTIAAPRPVHGDRYVAQLTGAINPESGGLDLAATAGSVPARAEPVLEVIFGTDTTRVPWPLRVTRAIAPPIAVVLDDDPHDSGGTDRTTIGRAYPTGTYTWFFPRGTRTHADMRVNDRVRLRLSHDAVAWVPAADVHPAPAAADPRTARMGSLTAAVAPFGATLRIPLSTPAAAAVIEHPDAVTIELYGAVSDANLTRYGPGQTLVRTLSWHQADEDRIDIDLTFSRPLWGWRWRVDGTDLVFEFRKPPEVDHLHPLAGRLVVLDPGHPPEGACGPTRLCEPEANLGVAMAARDLLQAAGARVVLTRTGMESVDLWPRVALADSLGADVLVSIHQNGLPDGLDPWTSNGSTTYFNHLVSLPLARAVQARLLADLGVRDLGVVRGDLALVRPTWYPSVLTEGLFLMIPEQEAALRTDAGRAAYARAVVEGIERFLAGVASPPATPPAP